VTRIVARITLGTAFVLVFAIAWLAIWRPVEMMRQVGLQGWRAESGRRCEDPPGMPWRHCYRVVSRTGRILQAEERVSFDRRSGRITELERTWQVADSAEWQGQQDSIALVLVRRGGEPIKCSSPTAGEDGVSRTLAWRFPEQDVRMIATNSTDPKHHQHRWLIQLSGFPIGYSGCQQWVRTRRLLTPTEMVTALHRWLAERVQ